MTDSAEPDWNALRDAAFEAARRAYAPYSQFAVGAALLGVDGKIYLGCNIENASYGLTQCAERSAVGSAFAQGTRGFAAIAIATPTNTPTPPCGMCRQVLAEVAPDIPVRCFTPSGEVLKTTVRALLPHLFDRNHLRDSLPPTDANANE